MGDALFLNGVFESVLSEIQAAQEKDQNLVCYLQPYKTVAIKMLREDPPSPASPITIYMSTTSLLSVVSYRAEIVGWEDKRLITGQRLEVVNKHLRQYQRGENEIDLAHVEEGGLPVNLIAIRNLEKYASPFPVMSLIKISDGKSYKPRTQSGGWSPVELLPSWFGTNTDIVQRDALSQKLQAGVDKSLQMPENDRLARLKSAPKMPEKVQIVSQGFRRNPDVVAVVLDRARGRCEECGNDAPFLRRSDKTPYLEVHHKKTLADGGEDTVKNSMAVCPNCHRKLHFGI